MAEYYALGGNYITEEDLYHLDESSLLDIMEIWFRNHYENPIDLLPYDRETGGYIWMGSGPFDAQDALDLEFGEIVDQNVINLLVGRLEEECFEWVSLDLFDPPPPNSEYFDNFITALGAVRSLNQISVDPAIAPLLSNLLFTNLITILETYLSDAFIFTVLNDPKLIRSYVETTPFFKQTKTELAKIFKNHENIESTVRNHLNEVRWHRLDMVKNMYRDTLGISLPEFGSLASSINDRHTLVHRNGKTIDGHEIKINEVVVEQLAKELEAFVSLLDEAIA